MKQEYTYRYTVYCSAQGRAPDDQLEHDRSRFPGGCMCGYMLWVNGMWAEYLRRTKNANGWILANDQTAFDRMLAEMIGGH